MRLFVSILTMTILATGASAQQKTYQSVCAEAVSKNVPVVVGIGCRPAVPMGYLSYVGEMDSFDGEKPGIVVGVPRGTQLVRIDLPDGQTSAEIVAAVEKLKRSWQAPPRTSFVPTSTFLSGGG